MRPIRQRREQVFGQALKCVGFRLSVPEPFKVRGLQLALAERYGLVGVAAAHHLLLSSDQFEEEEVLASLSSYGTAVEEHALQEVLPRLPYGAGLGFPHFLGMLAREPLVMYVPLYRRLCPLEICLRLISEEFFRIHRDEIASGANWFKKPRMLAQFKATSVQSMTYALNFFERRQEGLEEVKEIALLGE